MKRTGMIFSTLAAVLGAQVASAEVTDEQIREFEARIAQLEQDKSVADASSGFNDWKINGFMSAGFGYLNSQDFSYLGLYDTVSYQQDAIVGLQIDAPVADKVHAVLQLVARGAENFAVSSEWAYIGYRPTDNDEIRVGRQRIPMFMLSEYVEVGYAYPWAKQPAEVYIPFIPTGYNGVSWKHEFSTGSWQHDLQVYFGSESFEVTGGTFNAEDTIGVGFQTSVGNWLFNLTYLQPEGTISGAQADGLAGQGLIEPMVRDTVQFGGVGVQYDNGKLLVMGEATRVKVDGYFPDTDQEYLTVGYRFGKWMPHLTYASTRISDADARPALPAGTMASACLAPPPVNVCQIDGITPYDDDFVADLLENAQDSATLGLRYDFAANAALKFDWTRVLDTHGTMGMFTRDDGMIGDAYMPGEDLDSYRVVLDVVF